jgi:hypothetical protein
MLAASTRARLVESLSATVMQKTNARASLSPGESQQMSDIALTLVGCDDYVNKRARLCCNDFGEAGKMRRSRRTYT